MKKINVGYETQLAYFNDGQEDLLIMAIESMLKITGMERRNDAFEVCENLVTYPVDNDGLPAYIDYWIVVAHNGDGTRFLMGLE